MAKRPLPSPMAEVMVRVPLQAVPLPVRVIGTTGPAGGVNCRPGAWAAGSSRVRLTATSPGLKALAAGVNCSAPTGPRVSIAKEAPAVI